MTRTVEYILVVALLSVGYFGSLAYEDARLAKLAIENQEMRQSL